MIFHIDVNSAFLSWEAAYRLSEHQRRLLDENDDYTGEDFVDILSIPAVIGGNEESRHGIVLAKSTIAKKYGIVTGEPLVSARKKCPEIITIPPRHGLYAKKSNEFIELLKEYAPIVEQFSIDEAFCDMSGTSGIYGDLTIFAHTLKDTIKKRLGFTVNIGISTNKLLAKMASDFKKPDMVHTLFPNEISTKFWPLPINDLFFVGKNTSKKLLSLGIKTIGDLANMDKNVLIYHFKQHGEVIWNYANGIDTDRIITKETATKSYGNSQTISFDVTDAATAKQFLLSLCENIGARIRADRTYISVVTVNLVDYEFNHYSHQTSLFSPTDVTDKIYTCACSLFDEMWNNVPIRLIGVSGSKASEESFTQYNMFDTTNYEKLSKLDGAIDSIRNKYGSSSIKRACFVSPKDDSSKH